MRIVKFLIYILFESDFSPNFFCHYYLINAMKSLFNHFLIRQSLNFRFLFFLNPTLVLTFLSLLFSQCDEIAFLIISQYDNRYFLIFVPFVSRPV